MQSISIAVLSEPGRRAHNEDACGYWDRSGPVCCVLSDGAGGHGGGDVAARLAVSTVLDAFASQPACDTRAIRSLIEQANRAVLDEQRRSQAVRDMRATLVVLVLDPVAGCAVWGHVGDSRLYCFRDGFVVAQTRDHSLYQSMVDAGFARDDERRGNPQRNVLTASLGSDDGFEAEVVMQPFAMRDGDAFLLCSDGLWDRIDERAMEASLQQADSPQRWLDDLGAGVVRSAYPSQDNYSGLAAWFGTPDFRTRLMAVG